MLSIPSGDILAAVTAYKALGVTLTVFFPIFILGAFTFVVAIKLNTIGIVLQRIMWLIYSVYLFISTGASLLAGEAISKMPDLIENIFGWFGVVPVEPAQRTVLAVLFIISIGLFILMVISNKWVIDRITAEAREAAALRSGEISKKAKTREKQLAESLEE
jgi:hypothetical protein